jgi:multiple sugar transport system substrate-binding protein
MKGVKMKKLLLWLVVLMLSVSIIATFLIVTTAAETQKVKVTYMKFSQPPYDDIIRQTAKDFMAENPEVEVEVLLLKEADLAVKVKTAIASGGGVDCFTTNNVEALWFLENDTLEEIMPSAFGKQTVQEVVDMWREGSLEAAGLIKNGKYYGLPFEYGVDGCLRVNLAYMKEAGLDPVKDIPTTWDEFRDVAKKMTVKQNGIITRNGFAINMRNPFEILEVVTTLMQQKGLDWATEQGLFESLDKPEAIEALKTFTGWATTDGIWDPSLGSDDRDDFGSGLNATCLSAGNWFDITPYAVKAEDAGVYEMPQFADGVGVSGADYSGVYVVLKQSKNKEWAWKFIDYMASRPEEYIKYGLYQPRKTLDLALVSKYIKNSDLFFNSKYPHARMLKSPRVSEIADAVLNSLTRVMAQGMSNEDSLKQLKVEVAKIIGK